MRRMCPPHCACTVSEFNLVAPRDRVFVFPAVGRPPYTRSSPHGMGRQVAVCAQVVAHAPKAIKGSHCSRHGEAVQSLMNQLCRNVAHSLIPISAHIRSTAALAFSAIPGPPIGTTFLRWSIEPLCNQLYPWGKTPLGLQSLKSAPPQFCSSPPPSPSPCCRRRKRKIRLSRCCL